MINFDPIKSKMEKPDKRSSILISAEKLFSEQGYEGTSTRQIAKESGANMSMINYYFGSKEGVFHEIINKRIKDFTAQLISINQDTIPSMEKLMKVIESYTRRIQSNVAFHKMMHRELSLSQRPDTFCKFNDAIGENIKVLEDIINEGNDNGSFRLVDNRMLIASIMGTISNVAITPTKVTHGTNLDMNIPEDKEILTQRLIVHLKDMVCTYLTPRK